MHLLRKSFPHTSVLSSARRSYYEPFNDIKDDHLAEASQWLLFTVLFTALLVKVDVTKDNATDQANLAAILIILSLIPGCYMAYLTLKELHDLALVGAEEGVSSPIVTVVGTVRAGGAFVLESV